MRKQMISTLRGLKRAAGQWLLARAGGAYRRLKRWAPISPPPPITGALIQRILVVDLLKIGDTVVATPAIHAIKDTFPHAHLTVVAQPMLHPLLAADPAIDELVAPSLRLRGRQFDLAIVLDLSLWGNVIAWYTSAPRRIGYDSFGRGFLLTDPVPAPGYWNTAVWDYAANGPVRHQVDSWLDLVDRFGIRPRQRHPRLYVSDSTRQGIRQFIVQNKVGPHDLKIAIHPASSPSYLWRPERFAHLADWLCAAYDARIFITGSRVDTALAQRIASRMSHRAVLATGIGGIDCLTALIAEMDLVISVDTCATHIGSAVGTQVIALFGPGDPLIWRPYGPGHVVIRAEGCECLGCKKSTCVREAHFCMDGITVEAVMKAADQMLKWKRRARMWP